MPRVLPRPNAAEQRQREHEDAVHEPEHPVVDDEEDREPGPRDGREASAARGPRKRGRGAGAAAAGLPGSCCVSASLRGLGLAATAPGALRLRRATRRRARGGIGQVRQLGHHRALGHDDLRHVPEADDAVLEPVQDQDREQAPAEEQHAHERDQVGDQQHDRGPRRGRPSVQVVGTPERVDGHLDGRSMSSRSRRRVRNSVKSSSRTSRSRRSAAACADARARVRRRGIERGQLLVPDRAVALGGQRRPVVERRSLPFAIARAGSARSRPWPRLP